MTGINSRELEVLKESPLCAIKLKTCTWRGRRREDSLRVNKTSCEFELGSKSDYEKRKKNAPRTKK